MTRDVSLAILSAIPVTLLSVAVLASLARLTRAYEAVRLLRRNLSAGATEGADALGSQSQIRAEYARAVRDNEFLHMLLRLEQLRKEILVAVHENGDKEALTEAIRAEFKSAETSIYEGHIGRKIEMVPGVSSQTLEQLRVSLSADEPDEGAVEQATGLVEAELTNLPDDLANEVRSTLRQSSEKDRASFLLRVLPEPEPAA